MLKLIATLVLCALLPPAALAQEGPAEPAQEEIVEQVLALQRRIEELLAALPPAVRAELRQRLAEAPPAPPGGDRRPASPTSETVPLTAPVTTAPGEIAAAAPAETVVEPAADPVAEPAASTTEPPVESAAPVIAEANPDVTEAAAPAVEPPPSDGIPKLIRRRSKRPPCNTLRPLDENGDGKISSADRYWRYFYVWTDRNGDRRLQDREVASAYDRKVRELAVSLETFIRTKGGLGEVRIEDRVVLDLRGDGFSERARRDDGLLVVDAGALSRGGGPRLLGPGGDILDGFQAFRPGLRLELAGELTELNCP